MSLINILTFGKILNPNFVLAISPLSRCAIGQCAVTSFNN